MYTKMKTFFLTIPLLLVLNTASAQSGSCPVEFKYERPFQELMSTEYTYNSYMAQLLTHMQGRKDLFSSPLYPGLSILLRSVQMVKESSDLYLKQLSRLKLLLQDKVILSKADYRELVPKKGYFKSISEFTNYFNFLNTELLKLNVPSNSELFKFFKGVEKSFPLKISVEAVLIKPIQRMPLISLLLNEIRKAEPENQVFGKNVNFMKKILIRLNENKREFDSNFEKVLLADQIEIAIKKWGSLFLALSPEDRLAVLNGEKSMSELKRQLKKYGKVYGLLNEEEKGTLEGLSKEEIKEISLISSTSGARYFFAAREFGEEFQRLKERDKKRFIALTTADSKKMFLIRRHYGRRFLALTDVEKLEFLNDLHTYKERKDFLNFFFPKKRPEPITVRDAQGSFLYYLPSSSKGRRKPPLRYPGR